jgi:uncharacterized protein YtpQ (UPF0354 family)
MFGLFGKPSKAKFAQIVIQAAQEAGVGDGITHDEADFSLRRGKALIHLGNVYADYCRGGRAQKQQVVKNIIEMMDVLAKPVTREEALEQCVAVVRERALFEFLRLRTQIQGSESIAVAVSPLTDWFVRAVVLDAPGSMRTVSQKDLEAWKITFDELYAEGLARLCESTTPKFQSISGYFVGTWNDDYDASRILLPEVTRDLGFEADPVFCIPNRLTLLVADSEKPEAVKAMLLRAEDIVQNQPRPQNPAPLTRVNGEIVDFRPAADSALFHAVQRAKGITNLMYYQEQGSLLEQLHEKTGKDLYVAKYTLNERPDGSLVSYCVWSKGVPSLLPKTDLVMLFDPDAAESSQMKGAVKWEDLIAVVGDGMLDAGMFPPRYHVTSFPSDEQLSRMQMLEL